MLGRLLAWLPVAAVVAAAVLLAGWGNGPDPSAAPAPPPTLRGTTFPATALLSDAEAQSLVHDIGLEPRDLPPAFAPAPAVTRTALDERAGVDLCGAAYPSEGFRLAAHSAVFDAGDGRRVRTRVIAYQRGRAEQALAELRAAAPACTRQVPPEPGEQPGTLALRVRSTGSMNRAARHELVVERRGDVLVLLDTDRAAGSLTLDLARRLGVRLVSRVPEG